MGPDIVPIRTALISVSDKSGLLELGRSLHALNVEIISTGGTATTLRDGGIAVGDVSDWTGYPEMMDGRLKTLHPKIHGGLLAVRTDENHKKAMEEHGIYPIDLLVVNLYPFGEPEKMAQEPYDVAVEHIDIGGPAMIRAAAKNHTFVTVVTNPNEYTTLIGMIRKYGGTTLAYRKKLMCDAFKRTAEFDTRVYQSFLLRLQKNTVHEY